LGEAKTICPAFKFKFALILVLFIKDFFSTMRTPAYIALLVEYCPSLLLYKTTAIIKNVCTPRQAMTQRDIQHLLGHTCHFVTQIEQRRKEAT
jgi:hypothetical protein